MTESTWAAASSPVQDNITQARRVLSALASRASSVQDCEAAEALGVDWLRRQGLAVLAYYRWQAGALLPHGLKQALSAIYYTGVAEAQLQRHELATVLGSLNERRLPAIAFKGAALAYTV